MAIDALVGFLEWHLSQAPIARPSRLEDLSMLHLAKATGTTRSALLLLRERCWTDACILTRAVLEQLFAYLWVVQDPAKADARGTMVTIKQEWANAKYLEGLATSAGPRAKERLLDEAAKYKSAAEALLFQLATELGTTEKEIRVEATRRVSAKAVEVNVGPEFSIPYAHYSGFVHSDGHALESYGHDTPDGRRYDIRGGDLSHLPLASDMHRVLLRLASEVLQRCENLRSPVALDYLSAHTTWLLAVDAKEL
jgi:hypothetical protein